ncbi:MAG: hypothetical protein BJ554DRAFT_906 [Olpidium bornovanus]|uniref:Uncharacterized protein n=1 Tax=Olpidium bornovanus TaxID=278681 RepID=A0A8H7ZSY7_9FUNG|nr:MAG: hypothetical protein BJ554DRAFT_906 [Olpidium bornovanus]
MEKLKLRVFLIYHCALFTSRWKRYGWVRVRWVRVCDGCLGGVRAIYARCRWHAPPPCRQRGQERKDGTGAFDSTSQHRTKRLTAQRLTARARVEPEFVARSIVARKMSNGHASFVEGIVEIQRVASRENPADMFAKSLEKIRLSSFRGRAGARRVGRATETIIEMETIVVVDEEKSSGGANAGRAYSANVKPPENVPIR